MMLCHIEILPVPPQEWGWGPMGVSALFRVSDLFDIYFVLKVLGILKPFFQKGFERVQGRAMPPSHKNGAGAPWGSPLFLGCRISLTLILF